MNIQSIDEQRVYKGTLSNLGTLPRLYTFEILI